MLTFQLRDPFYKYCSATGAGLFAAVAGINTPFFIQCRDIFGDPANSASIRVDITGKVSRIISLSTLLLIDAVFEIDVTSPLVIAEFLFRNTRTDNLI
jgi:hypothetical protein